MKGALLLIAVPTILFFDVLFLGNNFWFRDLFLYHFPLKHIVRETIAGGEFPWWNPYLAGGQPMAANPAYEIFYPPQWLIFLGSFQFGFALHILFHLYLALLGMYAFLRSIPLHLPAALFGALSFGLSGFLLGTITNLPTFFVWSWAGVIGWAVLRLIRGGSIAPAALAVAMPFLIMEPIAVAQMVLLVVVGTAYVDRRAMPRVIGAILLAAGIAAVQIIPAIDHSRDSVRSRGFSYEVVTDYSMPPARPLELFTPRAFAVLPELRTFWGYRLFGQRGTPYLLSIHCGIAVAILSIAGLVTRQRGTAVVISIVVVSYLLAIGSHTPLWPGLYAVGVRFIRYPEKFIAAGVVALIVFAAITAERLVEIRRVAVIAAAIIGAALWIAAMAMTPATFSALWRAPAELSALARGALVVSAVVATLWCAVFWRFGTSRMWTLVAVALLLFELGSFSNEVVPRMPRSFFTPPPIVQRLDREATIFHRGEWTQQQVTRIYERSSTALIMRNGLRPYTPIAWGFRSALEADFDETDLLPTHDLLDAMIRRGNSGDPHWSEPFVAVSNVKYVLDYREASLDDPLEVTRVANRGRFSFPPGAGTIAGLRESSNRASIDVVTPEGANLLIAITRHKYWRATIDGRPVPLLAANTAYQALAVPAGRHRVELRYRNPLVLWGGAVSIVALLALPLIRPFGPPSPRWGEGSRSSPLPRSAGRGGRLLL